MALAMVPASAAAHAGLVSSEPSAGARLGASPDAVEIAFSEQPEASLSEIRVLGPGGEPEQVGSARAGGADPSLLEVPVRRLGKGVYTVDWKVLSAVDGHTSEGSFAFGVRESPTGAAASEGATTNRSSGFELLARWVFLLGVIALLGAAVAGVARFGGGSELGLAAVGLATALVGLVLLADAERIDAGSSLGGLRDSSIGAALVWRAVTLAVAGCALLFAWRRPRRRRAALSVAAVAALGTVVVHAGAGHADASSWPSALTVSAQVAHFAAAGVWLGGLAALILGFRRSTAGERGDAVRRFAPLALAAVAVLFATGILRAVDELVSWSDLLDSGYGRAVLAKVVLLALIAAIAARNRPRRRAPAGAELDGVRRRSRFELGLGVVAVGLAALLGTLAPPSSAQRAPLGLEAEGHDFGTSLRVELTTASNEPGPNRFQARISDYDSGDAVAADLVSLRFAPLDDPSVQPSSLVLRRGPDGTYVGSGSNVLFDGRWGVEALIERNGDAVEVPLELDFPVPQQFVSVLDVPGSPRPPQYTLQTEDGFIRLTPNPGRAGRNRLYIRTFSAFENSLASDQLVVTAAAPGGPARQLPVRRLAPARFVAVAELPAGPVEIGVFARSRYGTRLRGVFDLELSHTRNLKPIGNIRGMRGREPSRARRGRLAAMAVGCALVAAALLTVANPLASATSGRDPYTVPVVEDVNPAPNVVETTITAEEATVDIGNGETVQAQTFDGEIPGPTFELDVGDTVIVHFHNAMKHATGIHWHGIELANAEDGTPFTQDMIGPGKSFIYKFTVTRPGIYWYHPHHHSSTNQVFRGMYGMIYVRDPNEAPLQEFGVLPPPAETKQIVLSDTTACHTLGTNPGVAPGESHVYDDNTDDTPGETQPWAGSAVANSLPAQAEPSPKNLCEGPNVTAGGVENPYPIDEDGDARQPFEAGEIPNIQTKLHAGRTNEGTVVLTNGMNVGAQAGGPADEGYTPGALAAGASSLEVQPGQGLRLEIANAATTRFMRLQLTDTEGNLIPLYRVGGEGGLLNSAVLEGGTEGAWDSEFTKGEILLVPGQRADVVAAIPSTPTSGDLTLWTEDYRRLGGGYVDVPTMPVMHLHLAGPPLQPPYKIEEGTELRAATGDTISFLPPPSGGLLDPAGFDPPKPGMAAENIALTANGTTDLGIDGVYGTHDVEGSYMNAPHLGSTRYAKEGEVLELSVEDRTGAHHTFHLHGFSFQPIKLDAEPYGPGGNDYTWPYPQWVDNLHVPPHYREYFRVRLDPRPLADGVTPGGALGRWVFHCHIFFHHSDGMVSELVVTNPGGNERPDVNVEEGEVSVDPGQTARMTGTYADPDGDPVSLSASVGQVSANGDGTFAWSDPNASPTSELVYIAATDSHGLKDQIPFHLQVGPAAPTIVPQASAAAARKLVLSGLRVTPRAFAVKRKGKGRHGAKVRFALSDPATVEFTFKRLSPRKPARKAVSFRQSVKRPGHTVVRFSGRVHGKPLPPGRYMLSAVARAAGSGASDPVGTGFRIVASR